MYRRSLFLVLCALIACLTLMSTARAGLVGWWKLDETSGSLAFDSSGNGNDGTVQGNPRWAEGQLGGAWQGDGSAAFIQVPHSDTLMANDAVTVALWLSGGMPPDQVICKSNGSGSGWQSNYAIRLEDQAPARRINWRGRAVANQSLTSVSPLPDNEWVHIACTFDINAATNTIYINGALDSENTATLPLNPGDGALYLGADQYPANGARWWFQGMLDDVRIYDQALLEGQIQAIMLGGGASYPFASRPSPADGAMHEDTWVNLSWSAGDSAVSHDVYFGENFGDVNDGTHESETFRGNQTSTYYVAGFPGFAYPDGLVPGTTYYWRIDEVNDAEPNSPWTGPVWSFSIPPKTAYNPNPVHGAEFVDVDATLSWTGGFGAKLHTVYFGDNFDDVSNAAGGAPQGAATYKPASLELEKVYYWRVDEFDALATYKGDVWGFTTPGAAGSLQPANDAVDVQINSTLNWTPATSAVSHDLYFGTDKDVVKNATTTSPEYKGNRAVGSENYDPGKLAWHSDHYWRVDAVYDAGPVKGLVWNFKTADFLLVDDFESYNDIDPPDPNSNRIFDKWIDGFGTADNGALVGNDMPPYAEQTIVHGGAQSMPYLYDDNLKTSEATLTLVYPRDWTAEGVAKLSLWFRGAAANSAERMYVALNGNVVVYHDDSAVTQTTGWTRWVIDLQAFTDQGVNLANVNTITIGVGTKNSPAAGGTGQMYFDDIRLYR